MCVKDGVIILASFSNYEIRSNVLLDKLGWERIEIYRSKQLAVCMYKDV